MTGGADDMMSDLVAEAERIERVKNGQALTEDEAKIVKAAAFLRQIAPYLFPATAAKRKDA